VPANDPLSFERPLDLGAASVMVPMIDSAEAAAAVVAARSAMGTVPCPGAATGALRAAGHRLVVGPSDLARFRAAAVDARAAF